MGPVCTWPQSVVLELASGTPLPCWASAFGQLSGTFPRQAPEGLGSGPVMVPGCAVAAECGPCRASPPGPLCTLSLRTSIPDSASLPSYTPCPASRARASPRDMQAQSWHSQLTLKSLLTIGCSRCLVRDRGKAGDAATDPTIISGQCVAFLPAASPLQRQSLGLGRPRPLYPCCHPQPHGDVGEAPTGGAALSTLHVSRVKALGLCGDLRA